MKRNPNYHGTRPHPLAAIALREGVDATAALDRTHHGGWDGIVSSGHTDSELLDPLLDPNGAVASRYGMAPSSDSQYVAARLPETGYIVLNAVRGPFADQTVRRAAALAVDRSALAPVWNEVFSDQLLPPVLPGFHDRHFYPLDAPALGEAARLMRGRHLNAVMAIQANCEPCLDEGRLVRAELGRIGLRVKLEAFKDTFAAAAKRSPRIDIMDNGLWGYPDGAAFLESVVFASIPPSWRSSEVMNAVERVNRLAGNERLAAAAALVDRLVVSDVPVIPYGNRVNGEVFAPTVGCRIFPPASYGVDLAALCRRERP